MEISQVPIQEIEISDTPGLSQNSSAQNSSSQSFQKFLEEEQKRLGFLFAPGGQFNFSSWFAYPDTLPSAQNSSPTYILSSDTVNTLPSSHAYLETADSAKTAPSSQTANASAGLAFNSSASVQSTLQEILMKTGWLVPNMEITPQFNLAQLEGKLLQKLDLQSLVDQIVSHLQMVKDKGKVEFSLGLKPGNLGELILTLTSQGGMIYVSIQASEETRKIIQAHLNELEAALKKADVHIGEIKILATKEAGKNA